MKSLFSHIKNPEIFKTEYRMHCTIVQRTFLRPGWWASPTNRRSVAIRLIQREICRSSGFVTVLILSKIDQTQFIGMLDFSAWQDKDDLLVTMRKATETKSFIGMQCHAHNSRSRQSPNPLWWYQSMRTYCLKQRLCILVVGFLGECNTSLQVLAGANRALAQKNHVQARCKFSSSTPAFWAESKTCTSSS